MQEAPGRRAKAVLVVEDSTDVLETVVEAIRESGRVVFGAEGGPQALRLLDSGEIPRPCLILLDWVMSPMSGDEFVAELASRPGADQLPIIVMSARSDVEATGLAPNVLGTLRKPFGIEELLGAVGLFCDAAG